MRITTEEHLHRWRQIIQMTTGVWIGVGLYSIGDSLYEAYFEDPFFPGFYPPFSQDPMGFLDVLTHDIWERTRFRWMFTTIGPTVLFVLGMATQYVLPYLLDQDDDE